MNRKLKLTATHRGGRCLCAIYHGVWYWSLDGEDWKRYEHTHSEWLDVNLEKIDNSSYSEKTLLIAK